MVSDFGNQSPVKGEVPLEDGMLVDAVSVKHVS